MSTTTPFDEPDSEAVSRLAGKLGAARREHLDAGVIAEIESELHAARLRVMVARAVRNAPPLSQEQVDRIARILGGAA